MKPDICSKQITTCYDSGGVDTPDWTERRHSCLRRNITFYWMKTFKMTYVCFARYHDTSGALFMLTMLRPSSQLGSDLHQTCLQSRINKAPAETQMVFVSLLILFTPHSVWMGLLMWFCTLNLSFECQTLS